MSHIETREVPPWLRKQVDERDQGYCRFCGVFLGTRRVVHHILYGGDAIGIGGRRKHELGNLITLCGPFDNDCHGRVHQDKEAWQPILLTLVNMPYRITALQYRRWVQRKNGYV